jgi:hypothetical protein
MTVEKWTWTPNTHVYAPALIKDIVKTIVLIRAYCDTILLLIPNELLFLIFGMLPRHPLPLTHRVV